MDFGLSDEQHQLKDSARSFLSGECPTTAVRKMMATDDGYPRDLYAQIAHLGWNGLIVPEQFGGAGLGMLDMAMLLEECGYAAMPGPFLFSSVLAAGALSNSTADDLKAKWLPKIVDGTAVGTVAIVENAGSVDPADIWTLASKEGNGWLLNGAKMLVPYANVADFIIVAARAGTGSHDLRLFLIEMTDNGVKTRLLKGLDLTRRVSTLEMNCATTFMLDDSNASFAHLLDVASVAIAADS